MYSSLTSSVTSLSGGPVRVQDVKIQFTHSYLTITEVPQKIMLKNQKQTIHGLEKQKATIIILMSPWSKNERQSCLISVSLEE